MGTTGINRIFFPMDYVDTPYDHLHQFSVMDLNKNKVDLSNICKGKYSLVVNLASENKNSRQMLENLNKLKSDFKEKNFEILGFPSNQFMNERGNYEILRKEYKDVNFPIFSKVEINGEYIHPVFKFVKRKSILYDFVMQGGKNIKNDFSLFLFSEEGNKVVKYFEKAPDYEELKSSIDKIMNQKKEEGKKK